MNWFAQNADISLPSKKLSSEFGAFLKDMKDREVLIAGLGNYFRGDDSAGLILIDRLTGIRLPPGWKLLKCYETPENYLESLTGAGADTPLFIDTVRTIAGELKLFTVDEITDFSFSTHSFGLSSIIEYILKQRDFRIFMIGMKPHDLTIRTGISERMQRTVNFLFWEFEKLC